MVRTALWQSGYRPAPQISAAEGLAVTGGDGRGRVRLLLIGADRGPARQVTRLHRMDVRLPARRHRFAGPTMPRATPRATRSCGRMRSWSAVAGAAVSGRLRMAAASSGAMTEK